MTNFINFIQLIDDTQKKLNESFAQLKDENNDVQIGFLLCANVVSSYLIYKLTKYITQQEN